MPAAIGLGVNSAFVPPNGATPVAAGPEQLRMKQPAFGQAWQVGCERPGVMAAGDSERENAVRRHALERQFDRLVDQPGTR
jgi:hypothetical protein